MGAMLVRKNTSNRKKLRLVSLSAMNTSKNRSGTSGSTNKQLVIDMVVLGENSYFDESFTKIGGVVNYGVIARDRPEGV